VSLQFVRTRRQEERVFSSSETPFLSHSPPSTYKAGVCAVQAGSRKMSSKRLGAAAVGQQVAASLPHRLTPNAQRQQRRGNTPEEISISHEEQAFLLCPGSRW